MRLNKHHLTIPIVCISSQFISVSSAATLAPGDIIITEVMANPSAVTDANGEWFEIYNTTGGSLNLANLVLSDAGTNNHNLPSTDLILAPHSFFVFGRNDDSTTNGGYHADYQYSNFSLGNTSDQIILSLGATVISQLAYIAGFVQDGQSSELIALPMALANFAATPATALYQYGDGDYGTPGTMNSVNLAAVPLPAALPQLLIALGALAGWIKKSKK